MNTITVTGRLTADPDLRELPSGSKVCQIRLAVRGMGRNREPGYINVASYGPSGAAAADVLSTGWVVGVTGRLEWHEWETDGVKRQAHSIVGQIEFLARPQGDRDAVAPDELATPVGAAAGGSDDDIAF